MPNPLADEAAWLSQCIKTCKSLHEYYTGYCDSVPSQADPAGEFEILLATLGELDTTLKNRCFEQGEEQNQIDTIKFPISNCGVIINELQEEHDRISATVEKAAIGIHQASDRAAAYPFRQSTMQRLHEIVDDLQRHVSSMLNALNPKQQKVGINDDDDDDDDDLARPDALIQHMNPLGKSLIFEEWLPTVDATIDHRAIYAKRHRGTGLWLQKSHPFREWLAQENSLLWLNGAPGCGKSVLCSTAIQSTFCQQQQQQKHMSDVAIAFFYFSSAEMSKQGASAMFQELLLQLEKQQQRSSKQLASEILYQKYELTGPPEAELADCLRASIQRFRHAFVFLDGIDENPNQAGVLTAINKMRNWDLPDLHMLITSCDTPDIRSSLSPSPNEDIPLQSDAINQDISRYVTFKITNDMKLQRWKQYKIRIQQALTRFSQGVFRYAECQLEALKRYPRTKCYLEEFLCSLPRNLDETYERLLSNIDGCYINDTRRILELVCFSPRPLLVEELADAYAVDLKNLCLDPDRRMLDAESIRELCPGLVQVMPVVDSANEGKIKSTVCIAHSSLQKYLIREQVRHSNPARVSFQDKIAQAEMAQTCLVYLLEPELRTGELDETKLKAFPLAHYAAKFWFHLFQRAESNTQIESLVLQLFTYQRGAFDRWVELYDVDGLWESIYRADPALHGLLTPVYFASYLGLGWVLQDLLDGIDKDGDGSGPAERGLATALQIASWRGHEHIIQILLNNDANVNASGEWCGTALHAASRNGHQKAVQMLLELGADVNAPGPECETALHTAAANGHAPVVQMLLDWGVGVDMVDHHRLISRALQVAASRCHMNVVQMLVDRGADVNHKRGGQCGNALEAASRQGSEELVRLLLANGADVNAYSGLYGNPLCNAGLSGNPQVVQMLLDNGADVNAGSFFILGTPLMWATNQEDNEKVVELLLQQGAHVNDQGGTRGNALQNACGRGNARVVRLLLDWGADVNARAEHQGTALQVAARHGATDAVRILLDRGANANAPPGPHGTALEAALYIEDEEIVRMLRAAGAKPSKYCKL